ncbi:MAG: IS630 transposase-related protein [Tepidisphaeraceae bacterium]
MPYPLEFRIAVAADYDLTGSSIETADTFGVSESWVRRLIQRRRETGSLEVAPPKRPDSSKLKDDDLEHLATLITRKPDMTLGELAGALKYKASVPTVWRATQKLGLRLKKRRSTPASKIAPT